MAVQAQQLPVGAILRVIVVVVGAVVNGQLTQALTGKLAGAAAADVWVHLQCLVAVAFFTRALGLGEDAVKFAGGGGGFVAAHLDSRTLGCAISLAVPAVSENCPCGTRS